MATQLQSPKTEAGPKPGGKAHTELATTLAESIDLKRMIALETERRQLLREYLERQMVPNLHYYWLSEQDRKNGRKPSLSKEGALNLAELCRCRVEPEIKQRIVEPDDHFTVETRVRLFHRDGGQLVATGDGLCSTRETKYAIRWLWPGEAEVAGIKEQPGVVTRMINTRRGKVTQYRSDNEKLADQWNTVLKMSFKRAVVAAALLLPCVSELFTQDLEEQLAEAAERVEDREEAATEDAAPKTRGEALTAVRDAQKALRIGAPAVCAIAGQLVGREIKSPADLKDPEMIKLAVDLRTKVAAQTVRQTEAFEAEPPAAARPAAENGSAAETSSPGTQFEEPTSRPAVERGPSEGEQEANRRLDTEAARVAEEQQDEPLANIGEEMRRFEQTLEGLDFGTLTLPGWILKNYHKSLGQMTALEIRAVREEVEGRLMAGGFDPAEEVARGDR